jgi:hypothetical protein
LLENNSKELVAASKEGGMIRRVCVASATFCSRLERKALEQSEPGRQQLPPSQSQNLLTAILGKKAHIAEIERTLNPPRLIEYPGQRVHGGEGWRLRLEEERQHLLIAVQELQAELERIIFPGTQNSGKAAQAVETKPTNASAGGTREAFLKPILKEKGFSVHDWAKVARVDFHTANDYLKGKTNPHASNLKKLADALGVEVAKLPK